MGPSLDLSLISSWLLICAKQGPKAGSSSLYVFWMISPVQLSADCCDEPVIPDLDAPANIFHKSTTYSHV